MTNELKDNLGIIFEHYNSKRVLKEELITKFEEKGFAYWEANALITQTAKLTDDIVSAVVNVLYNNWLLENKSLKEKINPEILKIEREVDTKLYNKNIKEKFLSDSNIKEGTRRNYRYILSIAAKTEELFNKDICEMNDSECKELLLSYPRKSESVINVVVCCLNKYVQYCKNMNLTNDIYNYFANISGIEEIRELINISTQRNKYITREDLLKYYKILKNEQDIALLELLFKGIKPDELLELKVSDVTTNKIILKNREILIDDFTHNIILNAINQKIYEKGNGDADGNSVDLVINDSEYVIRPSGATRQGALQYSSFQMRFKRIKKYLENHYLTPTNVWVSGQIHMAKKIKATKGNLTKTDYQKINEEFGTSSDYWYQTKVKIEKFI